MMSILWALGGFFLILTPIILVHEYGHFIAARLSNIRVEEFGLGFPPRAATLFEHKGTKYTLNWIPLGGFVRPAGEDDRHVGDGLAAASKRARFFVLVSGALANFILALVIFWVLNILPQPVLDESLVVVRDVAPGSPAERAGLQAGDVFVEVNGQPIGGDFDALITQVQQNLGQEINFIIERAGEQLSFPITPRLPNEYDAQREGAVGVGMMHPETGEIARMNPLVAVLGAGRTMWEIVSMTIQMPAQVISGQVAPSEARVVSVVGISQMTGQAAQLSVDTGDISYILSLTGVISVALGFTNLLPIPALDGGRILFVLIEAVRGRRIEPEQEGMVHAVGMALLLGLMVILIVQDVINPIVLPS